MIERLFFLTTNPGLESAAHLELCKKWAQAADFFNLTDYPDVTLLKGGVEFKAPLEMANYLNKNIKTATRILLREKQFQAPHEKEFEKALKEIDWASYFPKNSSLDFKFQSESSKLSHSKQITRVLQRVLKPYKIKIEKQSPALFIRIMRDQCTISIDTTGEAGFERLEKGSVASLRPSLASGLLQILFQGLNEPIELIDPMCGAGTFLSEALNLNAPQKRAYRVEKFPIFKSFEELKNAPTPDSQFLIKKVIGYDFHEKAIKLAQQNLESFSNVEIEKQDLFDSQKKPKGNLKRVVVVNPPWGKRLHQSSKADVIEAIYQKFNPDRIGFLMPARWKTQSIPLEKVRDIPIFNSGVENRFLVFS